MGQTIRWTWFVCLILLFITAAPRAEAAPRQVAVVAASATGAEHRTVPNGGWTAVGADAKLAAGTAVRTGASPLTISLLDGAVVRIEPNSLLLLREPTQVDLRPGVTEPAHRIDLKSGGVEFELPDGRQRLLFLVHTDEILGVFGHGAAQARIVGPGMLTIVKRGYARVASHGRWIDLHAGHYLTLGAPGAPRQPKTLAAAPRFLTQRCHASTARCGIAVVQGADKAPLAVRWSAVPEARAYHVRLATDAEMKRSLIDKTVGSTEVVTKPMAAGSYWFTVQSIGKDGVPGNTAGPRPLRVVQLLLDQGAQFVGNHVVVLPKGTKVRIVDPQGLAQSTSTGTTAVPSTVRLSMNQKVRLLKLFLEGHPTDTATIRLERRQLHAEVTLTPTNPQWPRDAVTLRVRLHDPSKRLSASDVYPRIQASLNRTRLSLPLRRTGDTWQARIPARSGKGPWVLRVDVTDLDGRPLGHGFAEISGTGSD